MKSREPPVSVSARERPIFIVGPSRSGTSLAMRTLRSHPEIHVTGETHYFDDLRTKLADRSSSPLSPDEKRTCEDYFLSIAHRGYGKHGDPDNSPMERSALRAAAETLGLGTDAYFAAFCKLQAVEHKKERWGEKTPRHVYRIDDILACFPDAKILCMIRDPRAVILSYRNMATPGSVRRSDDSDDLRGARIRKQRSYDLIVMSLMWRSTVHQAVSAQKTYGSDRVHLLRYEDLVAAPRPSLAAVADWLDVAFSERMLQVDVHNSTFVDKGAIAGVSSQSVRRWTQHLSEAEISAIQIVCGRPMREFDYALAPTRHAPLHFAGSLLRLPYAALRATVANRSRTGQLLPYVWRRVKTLAKVSK